MSTLNAKDRSGRTEVRRYALLDMLRGLAILAMGCFHAGWDLAFLGVISADVSADPAWVWPQRLILSSFLLLAGIGLALAHGEGVAWARFLRREAVLLAAALAVSLGTYLAFGSYFAFFGVLHAIALFSLFALPFLFLQRWVSIAVGLTMLALPAMLSHPAFVDPRLAWIGFWPISPPTVDLVPVFPWFGVLLIGVALGRLFASGPWPARLAGYRPGLLGRGLATLGRWSLLIYLVHQPLIYGALLGLVTLARSG